MLVSPVSKGLSLKGLQKRYSVQLLYCQLLPRHSAGYKTMGLLLAYCPSPEGALVADAETAVPAVDTQFLGLVVRAALRVVLGRARLAAAAGPRW